MKNSFNNKGFSLIELLGVVVILGILLSMGIAAYSRYRRQAAEDSYNIMSENAASAAEDYFMDNINEEGVTIEKLVQEEYLEKTVDPMFKDEVCTGTVNKFNIQNTNGNAIESNTYKVVINCKKHSSCNIYPKSLECDPKDGIKTDGEKTAFSMGLRNFDFGSEMSLAIRVKFNSFPNDSLAYFGNWENAGGGLGLTADKHNFYFNQYSKSANNYYAATSNVEAKLNKWYVVVGVVNNNTLKLYVNGSEEASTTFPTGGIKVSPLEVLIGGNPTSSGTIAEAVPITSTNALIFNRALTPQEISNYFSTPNEPINYTASDALVNKIF